MALKPRFRAKVVEGKLTFRDPPAFYAHLWKFKPEDELVVTVDRPFRQRSLRQNAYYWGVVLRVVAKETGHTEEELHEIYKRMFLPRKVIQYKGKDFPVPGSTTESDSVEFTEYIERVRAEAATLGIQIPNPDQVDF